MDKKVSDAERTAPWHLLEGSPYLRHVTLLVVLLSFGMAGADYVFKAKAASIYTDEAVLVSFFSVYYLLVGIASFVIQNTLAKGVLRRGGIAVAVATFPLVILFVGGFALLVPTLLSFALLSGSASTIEGSTYRSGYELLYTPIPPCLLYTSPSPRDATLSRMPSSA